MCVLKRRLGGLEDRWRGEPSRSGKSSLSAPHRRTVRPPAAVHKYRVTTQSRSDGPVASRSLVTGMGTKRRGNHENGVLSAVLESVAVVAPLTLALTNFEGLVRDPVTTLLSHLPIVLVSTFLPRLIDTHSTLSQAVRGLGLLCLYFIPGTYVLVVLTGAPFTTHIPQTILFSTILAIMIFTKAVILFDLDSSKWAPLVPSADGTQTEDQSEQKSPHPHVKLGDTGLEGIVWGTMIGAYAGAIPIPLDWDRDWQKWPVTVHLGACIGLVVGSTLQLLYNVWRGSRPLTSAGISKTRVSAKKVN